MDALRICRQCQQPLPEDAPEGLCPACLAKVALGSEPAAPGATINVNPLAEAAPTTRAAPEPAQLAAQFPQLEIIELLGMGGMGMVYKARQPRVDRLVALKILPVDSARGASFAERFEREAKALAKLNHPGIVTFYDFGQTSGYYYFIMEYVDGMNLRRLLQTQPLDPRQALELVVQICTALQYAHDEGVVHRDIKPENILLNKKGQVKIADFGLAKLLGTAPDTALTMSQAAMGTMNYMAPEQRQNAQGVDHRADIYSLGVVFYEMLTGEVPMGRFEAPSKRVQVDVRLDEVVLKALEREPARRYQQVSEVKSNVETITATPAAAPRPPAEPGMGKIALTRYPALITVLVLLAVGVGVLDERKQIPDWLEQLLLTIGIVSATVFVLRSRQQIQQARDRGLWPQLGELPTHDHVKRMVNAGEKILAIKLYRQMHGASLEDAKAAVEKLAGEAKSTAEPPTSTMPKAPALPPDASKVERRPNFVAAFLKPSRLWALAVVVGAFTGFAPEWACTTRYWGVWATDDPNAPVQVIKVASDSPAEQTGFRLGDIVKEPTNYASFSKSWDKVKQGEKQTFTVRRNGQDVVLEATAGQNQIAVVWYANLWYPIAGALFILVGIVVFATAPVASPPLWRSIAVAIAGLGIAIGFAVAVAGDGVFSRFAVYERWIFVPTRNDWCGLQGLFGMAAAILMATLAATEIRQRLRKPHLQSGPAT